MSNQKKPRRELGPLSRRLYDVFPPLLMVIAGAACLIIALAFSRSL